ncbi:hypothetical protein ABMA46_18455 [Mesorhizobium sp. CN5-321]|jgi:hypothetical protein|uniref:hypothetical protein n=1 Tax=Mesorhizobium hunchu TaxID=3157708 RepID=UPI0032B8757B
MRIAFSGARGPSAGPFHSVCGLVRLATISLAWSMEIVDMIWGVSQAGNGLARISAEAPLAAIKPTTVAIPQIPRVDNTDFMD